MPKRVVDVLVRSPSTGPIPYRVPEALALAPGDIVSVPLGARGDATAVVWAENARPDPGSTTGSKTSSEKLDLPPLKDELRHFVDWVANYTIASRGMVLRMCLRMGEHLGAERERVGVRLAGAAPARMTAARGRVLELLADGILRGKSEAAREAGVCHRRRRRPDRRGHAGDLGAAARAGRRKSPIRILRNPISPPIKKPPPPRLKATVGEGKYSVTLLDGVTGSGKTEVISRRSPSGLSRAGSRRSSSMPEIALTSSVIARVARSASAGQARPSGIPASLRR